MNDKTARSGKTLFSFKHGDVQRGNWSWAIGASPRVPEVQPPICVATINFHGAVAAGHDPEKLAPILAEAPAMVAALRRILDWIDAGCDPSRKSLENARAILSRIDGATPPLSAYAGTVSDEQYREIANGRADWPLATPTDEPATPTGELITVLADEDEECATCAESNETRVFPCDECGTLDGEPE